jgi:hypothetical protein
MTITDKMRGSSTITMNTDGEIIGDWKLIQLSSGWKMIRMEGRRIVTRELTFWEKIKYYLYTWE